MNQIATLDTPSGMLQQAADTVAPHIDGLFTFMLLLCGSVALGVVILLVTFCVRYREGAKVDREPMTRKIGIEIVGHCNGETRFRTKQVLVTTSLESGTSIDIPTDIASALATFAPQPDSIEAHRS